MLILIALAILAAPNAADQSTRQPDAVERSTDAQDKMICKRFVDTGSLVRGTRVCKTKHEWELDRAQIRARGPGVDSCRSRANGGEC
ncbi:MAG: hypothetical protein ABIS51_22445 [Sphingomonas sp.]